jgi:membrane protease YdiL (CAAX protease family)
MMKMNSFGFQISAYLALTFILSWIQQYFIIRGGGVSNSAPIFLLMWTPGLVGMFCSWIFGYRLKDIGFRWGSWKYYAIAYAIPAVTAMSILALLLVFGMGEFQLSPELIQKKGSVRAAILALALWGPIVGAAVAFTSALGEEIGWRGFLHSRLMDAGIRHPFLITGAIWAFWHWPLILFSNYATSDMPLLSLILFTMGVTAMSVNMGVLRAKSGSVFSAALIHGTHNLWIQGIYPALLKKGPLDPYFGGESGVFIVVIYGLIAVFIYRRYLTEPPD